MKSDYPHRSYEDQIFAIVDMSREYTWDHVHVPGIISVYQRESDVRQRDNMNFADLRNQSSGF